MPIQKKKQKQTNNQTKDLEPATKLANNHFFSNFFFLRKLILCIKDLWCHIDFSHLNLSCHNEKLYLLNSNRWSIWWWLSLGALPECYLSWLDRGCGALGFGWAFLVQSLSEVLWLTLLHVEKIWCGWCMLPGLYSPGVGPKSPNLAWFPHHKKNK